MDMDFIYMPYNIRGCHWILIVLGMIKRQINVWDSFIDLTLANLDNKLDNMRCVVPTLM